MLSEIILRTWDQRYMWNYLMHQLFRSGKKHLFLGEKNTIWWKYCSLFKCHEEGAGFSPSKLYWRRGLSEYINFISEKGCNKSSLLIIYTGKYVIFHFYQENGMLWFILIFSPILLDRTAVIAVPKTAKTWSQYPENWYKLNTIISNT